MPSRKKWQMQTLPKNSPRVQAAKQRYDNAMNAEGLAKQDVKRRKKFAR